MKWLILLLLFVAAPALALVDVTLVPSSQTVTLGSTVTLTITLNTDGTSCDGVDASINYDPAFLTIVSVTPILSPFDQVLQNKTSTAGQIDYSAGTFGTPGSGTFTVATVRFTAAAVGTTNITFNSTSPRKTDTALSGVSNFGTATGASVTIIALTGPTPTPTPQGCCVCGDLPPSTPSSCVDNQPNTCPGCGQSVVTNWHANTSCANGCGGAWPTPIPAPLGCCVCGDLPPATPSSCVDQQPNTCPGCGQAVVTNWHANDTCGNLCGGAWTGPVCCHCPDGSCAAAPCPQGCLAILNAVCQ